MLKLKKVVITGGVSCGKSSVCHYFNELGAYTLSADDIVHQLLSPSTELGKKVIELLGNEIVDGNEFDRKKIAHYVFTNRQKLDALEKLVHPRVRNKIKKKYQEVKNLTSIPLFVVEEPLFFEINNESFYDYVITVTSYTNICIERFKKSTTYNSNEFYIRTKRQLDLSEKIKKSDDVIVNNGTLEELKQSVKQAFTKLVI